MKAPPVTVHFACAFGLVLLFGMLAAEDAVSGSLDSKPWTATTAVAASKFPVDGWWTVLVTAGKDAPGLLLKVPSTVGVHPLDGRVSAIMIVPPGGNVQAHGGEIEVVSIGERVVLRLNLTIKGTDKVAGLISFATTSK